MQVRQRSAVCLENITAAGASFEEGKKGVSHTTFLSISHLCNVVAANFAKRSWPTSIQNQVDSRAEPALPPIASYVREMG